MSIVSKAIANLFNGVSQQSASLRLPSQADAQVNCESSPVDGLGKRAPTNHIARLFAGQLDSPLIHSINRDASERYQVVLTGDDLKVFDMASGQERTVSFTAGKQYLTVDNAREQLKTLTVEDYTFILNKSVVPEMAVTPYLSTDQVGVSINFGSGELTDAGVWPLPNYSRFRWAWKNSIGTFNTSGTGSGGAPYTTFAQALQGLKDAIAANTNYEATGLDDAEWLIEEDAGSLPAYDDGSVQVSVKGVRATPKVAVLLRYMGGPAYNGELRLLYTKTTSGGTPIVDLTSLKADVGWPQTPFHIPGVAYQEHVVGMTDGAIVVEVNGVQFTKTAVPDWSAEDYLGWFRTAISAAFPSLEFDTSSGWQLNITAPAGERLFVRAYDTNGRGYVQTSYRNLPVQEALFIVIKTGLPDQTYSVSINGQAAQYTTPAADTPDGYTTETIAQNLTTQINGFSGGYQAANYGSFIKVINTYGTPISFAWKDTYGNTAMYAMKNRLMRTSDLPAVFIPGHPLEIAGPDGTEGYYVHYVIDGAKPAKAYGIDRQVSQTRPNLVVQPAGNTWNAIEGKDTGCWVECAKPGVPDVLIPTSMPHVLVSQADGSFEFKTMDWFKRSAGDEDSVPAPSFVGKRVVDLLFTRNRFAMMCAESIVFSRSGQFFNFWAETAKDVLDSDPIDVLVNHHKVATLRHSAVFNTSTVLFSDSTQFVVSARDTLTPKTVNVQPATEYDCSRVCKPISLGANVFFVSDAGGYSSVWEYFLDSQSNQNVANSITAHVPKYIPKGVFKLAGSVELNRLVALTGNGTVYVYRFLNGPEGKVQESWSQWQFSGSVLNADFIESDLFLTVQYDDGVFLERVELRGGETEHGLDFLVHLDRKTPLVGTPVEPGVVSVEVPYDAEAVFADPASGGLLDAQRMEGNTWRVVLDEGSNCLAGVRYQSSYRFSPVYMRDEQKLAVLDGRLTLKTFTLNYEKTCAFEVKVQPKGRTERNYKFVSLVGGGSLVGRIQPDSGVFRFMVMGEGKDTRIELVSESHLPFFFQGASWEADFTMRTRRV